MASNVLAKLGVVISAITQGFDKAMQNSSKELKGFTDMSATASKALAAFGIGFGIYEVASGIKNAIGVMAEFEKTMSEVKAITGATGDEFNRLREDALRLGASTKFTATEVGKLQIAYGRLGFTTKEILKATEATLSLAAATGEDLAKSADVAGSTVRGFGLDAKETQRVVDVMASSFNKSALGLENFAESMKYVAPVAHAAGASLEETTALLATLADAGIRGSMAGTSLRKIFTDIAKDGRPLSERLEELGKKGITMSDAFDEVGRTAQTSLLILAKNTDKTNQLATAFGNASGEAAKMARIMQDNLAGDVDALSSAWEGLILNLSKTDVLRDVTQSLTALMAAISGAPSDGGQELKRLAADIKQFGTDASNTFQGHIEILSQVRREIGKPFDLSLIEDLASKYNLTSEEANRFYQVILQANEALSFQEKAMQQFNEFVARNGYQDLSKAADDYKNRLYELVLAEEIRKRQLEDLATASGENFDKDIAPINEQIAAYKRVIRLIADYQKELTSGETEKVQPVLEQTVKSLEHYRKKLQEVNQQYDQTSEKDTSRLRILAQEIQGLQDKIRLLEMIRKNAGKDFSSTPEMGSSGLTLGIDEAAIKRMEEVLLKFQQVTTGVKDKVKEMTLEMSGSITSAIIGIADAMGSAIVGVGNFGDDILKVLASFARQVGETLIGIGVAMLAAKVMLKNPYTAIAAGVALVALAGALSASLSKAQSNFNSGGSGGAPRINERAGRNFATTDGNRIDFDARFVIDGNSLVAVVDKTNTRNHRLKG
jgi:hypothetical protein